MSFILSVVASVVVWTTPATAQAGKRVIAVGTIGGPEAAGRLTGDVRRLYDVIDQLTNNPASFGLPSSAAIIELAPGATYVLDPALSPSTHGRLILPPGADLRGGNVMVDCDGDGVPDPVGSCVAGSTFDPDRFVDPKIETIIDGHQLPAEPMGVLLIGRQNRIQALSIKDYPDPKADSATRNKAFGVGLIDIVLHAGGKTAAEVDSCIVENGLSGANISHVPGSSGVDSQVTIERSIFRKNSTARLETDLQGFGIVVQNAAARGGVVVDNTTFNVTLRDNRSYGNKRFGLFVGSSSSSTKNRMTVLSTNNVYERNGAGGWAIFGGRDGSAIGNNTRVESEHDAIWNNGGTEAGRVQGIGNAGIIVIGGFTAQSSQRGSADNTVRLQLTGTRFVKRAGDGKLDGPQNRDAQKPDGTAERRDIKARGAFGNGGLFPGVNNLVELLLKDVDSDGSSGAILTIDSDPAATNQVKVTADNLSDKQEK